MILCRFLIFIPVEKVPSDATTIAFFCFSTIPRIASLSAVSVPPDTKKTLRPSATLLSISSNRGFPCFST